MKIDITKLVNRFLCWPLPKSFTPDCGISFDGRKPDARGYLPPWPVGTNLFTAEEARQLFEHALGQDGTAESGVDLIAAERTRQIEQEGWTPEHDDEHDDHSLALAAACYAAPKHILVRAYDAPDGITFGDPWPWADEWDKRPRDIDGMVRSAEDQTHAERIRCLVKAGALIAAEIDRLRRLQAAD